MSVLGDEFDAAVARLQNAGSQFMGAYEVFVAIPPQYRSATWGATKDRADYVRGTISAFANAIDTAYRWASSAFGLEGMAGLGQLGVVIPALPWLTVAAIGGAISLVMVTYGYMSEEINKANYTKRIVETNLERAEQGLPPLSTDIVPSDSIFGGLSNAVKWMAIGGFVLFALPKLLDRMKG